MVLNNCLNELLTKLPIDSYKAREYVINSGMPVSQAYKLVQMLLFLPVNIRLYVQASDNVMETMKCFADKFQQYSIDEAFLVLKPEIKNFEEAAVIAQRIKDEIKRQERITCSVGVGQTKPLLKFHLRFEAKWAHSY